MRIYHPRPLLNQEGSKIQHHGTGGTMQENGP